MATKRTISSEPVGQSLTSYPFVDVFEAKTARDLAAMLGSLRMPFRLIGSPYFANGRHIAIVSLTRPIKKPAAEAVKQGV